MTASRFSVAYRPGKVRAWVVLYRTTRGDRIVVDRHLTKTDAEEAIPGLTTLVKEA